MLLAALRLANRDPVAHVRQLSQDKRGIRAFGIRNKAFGQAVIGPALKTGLLPAIFLKRRLALLVCVDW